MALVTSEKMLADAQKGNYAVGAFNVENMEMVKAVLAAAEELHAPVMLQTTPSTVKYGTMETFAAIVAAEAKKVSVPVCLHLDHAKDFDEIKAAIDAGFSSVMFDGSALPFKENIAKTKMVVAYAHAHGASVEGELGTIGGTEEGICVSEDDKKYTRPQDAAIFVKETNVDALAIAIGTNHGQYQSKTEVNIPLLKKIHAAVDIPLVLHGGTGVKEEDYQELIDNGIRKFNVGTELLVNWTRVAKEKFQETEVNKSLRHNIIPANMAVKEIVKHKAGLFMNLYRPLQSK